MPRLPNNGTDVILLQGGWYDSPDGEEVEGQIYLSAGTRGRRKGDYFIFDSKRVELDEGREEDDREPRIVSYAKFMGSDLTARQRRVAEKLTEEFGGSYSAGFGSGWGRSRVPEEMGTIVPIPPSEGHFINFSKEDARKLAAQLRNLKDQPVILTGGGGYGAQWVFLEDVKVKGGSVRPMLRAFPGETTALENLRWNPYMGSYRLTAIHGYGAEKIFPKGTRKDGKTK